MGIINDFGFEIYRLKQAQDNCEFLLYDVDNKKYYQYSFNRGKQMLKMLIEKISKSSLLTYMKKNNHLDFDAKNQEAQNLFNDWILEDIQMIDNINYKPIDNKIFEDDNATVYFNTYQKSELLKLDVSKYKGDFPYIKAVLMNLVAQDEKAYIYLTKWLAWQIQKPLERLATSIVFKGAQGSGKTLCCNYILKPIFETNFLEIGQSDINKEFNEYIMGKQLIIANEVIYNEKRLAASEKLKNYVSDDFVNINRKYRDGLFVRNYSQWIFTSNNQVPIRIEKNDRRFSVFVSKKLDEGVEFFQEFILHIEEERKHFLNYLQNLDVVLKEINYPYVNAAKKDIIEASLNSVELFFETVEEAGGIDALNKDYMGDDSGWFNDNGFMSTKNYDYVKLENLYKLYQRFCWHAGIKNTFGRNGFSSMLKHLQYHITVIKDDNSKSHRVMQIGGKKNE